MDESLVIPWRYLGGSLEVTLPNTYPKSRQKGGKCESNLIFYLHISKKSSTFAANLDKSTNFAGTGSVKKR